MFRIRITDERTKGFVTKTHYTSAGEKEIIEIEIRSWKMTRKYQARLKANDFLKIFNRLLNFQQIL